MPDHTIADIKLTELSLEVKCLECTRTVLFPHRRLPQTLRDDLPVRLAAAFFRCPTCKSKNVATDIVDKLAEQPAAKPGN